MISLLQWWARERGGFEWSSSLDGHLGAGHELILSARELTTGSHVITVTKTDSDDGTALDSVTINYLGGGGS